MNLFLEWLYTGDYKFPYPSIVGQGSEENHAKDQDILVHQEVDQDFGKAPSLPLLESYAAVEEGNRVFDKVGTKASGLLTGDVEECAEPEIPDRPLTPLADLRWSGYHSIRNTSQAEEFEHWLSGQPEILDYEHTLLTNAKLYVMADYFLLSELQNLTLHYLRSSLLKIKPLIPESPQMSNVAHLIEYVYEHTVEHTTGENPMRKLVSQYAALQFAYLKGGEIRQLMVKGGDFVPDLMKKVQRAKNGTRSTPSPWKKGKKGDIGLGW